MTREDVILLAKQCGIGYRDISEEFYTGYCDGVVLEQMYAFALRAIEKEREACAKFCEGHDLWGPLAAKTIRERGEA
jgi:hypothetical protein